jgi:hypothetical protein
MVANAAGIHGGGDRSLGYGRTMVQDVEEKD